MTATVAQLVAYPVPPHIYQQPDVPTAATAGLVALGAGWYAAWRCTVVVERRRSRGRS